MQLGNLNSSYGALAIDLQSEYITDLEQLEEDVLEERGTMDQEEFVPPEPTVSLDGSGSIFGQREMIEVRRSSPQFVVPEEPEVMQPMQLFEEDTREKSVKRGTKKRVSPQSMVSKVTRRRKVTDESTPPSRSPASTTGIRESYVPRHPTVSSGRQQETPDIHPGPRRVLWPSATHIKSESKRSMAMSPDDSSNYGNDME